MEAKLVKRKQELLDECNVPRQVFDQVTSRLERFMTPFVESLARKEQIGHAQPHALQEAPATEVVVVQEPGLELKLDVPGPDLIAVSPGAAVAGPPSPTPSGGLPPPATVVMMPLVSTLRTRALPHSAM